MYKHEDSGCIVRLPDSEEFSPDADDAINNILLPNFEDRLKYTHRNGHNYIRISAVKSAYASLFRTLGAIGLAVIAGLLLKNYASSEFCGLVSKNMLSPVRNALMNALKIVAVSLVFSAQAISSVIAVLVFFVMRPMFSSSAGTLSHMVQVSAESSSNLFVEFL